MDEKERLHFGILEDVKSKREKTQIIPIRHLSESQKMQIEEIKKLSPWSGVNIYAPQRLTIFRDREITDYDGVHVVGGEINKKGEITGVVYTVHEEIREGYVQILRPEDQSDETQEVRDKAYTRERIELLINEIKTVGFYDEIGWWRDFGYNHIIKELIHVKERAPNEATTALNLAIQKMNEIESAEAKTISGLLFQVVELLESMKGEKEK